MPYRFHFLKTTVFLVGAYVAASSYGQGFRPAPGTTPVDQLERCFGILRQLTAIESNILPNISEAGVIEGAFCFQDLDGSDGVAHHELVKIPVRKFETPITVESMSAEYGAYIRLRKEKASSYKVLAFRLANREGVTKLNWPPTKASDFQLFHVTAPRSEPTGQVPEANLAEPATMTDGDRAAITRALGEMMKAIPAYLEKDLKRLEFFRADLAKRQRRVGELSKRQMRSIELYREYVKDPPLDDPTYASKGAISAGSSIERVASLMDGLEARLMRPAELRNEIFSLQSKLQLQPREAKNLKHGVNEHYSKILGLEAEMQKLPLRSPERARLEGERDQYKRTLGIPALSLFRELDEAKEKLRVATRYNEQFTATHPNFEEHRAEAYRHLERRLHLDTAVADYAYHSSTLGGVEKYFTDTYLGPPKSKLDECRSIPELEPAYSSVEPTLLDMLRAKGLNAKSAIVIEDRATKAGSSVH